MDDRQTYDTETEALAAAHAMLGWPDPHPVEIEDDGGPVWVLAVDPDDGRQPRYLRRDGFVR